MNEQLSLINDTWSNKLISHWAYHLKSHKIINYKMILHFQIKQPHFVCKDLKQDPSPHGRHENEQIHSYSLPQLKPSN